MVEVIDMEGRPHHQELALAPVGVVLEGDAAAPDADADADGRAALVPVAVIVVDLVPALQRIGQLDVAEALLLARMQAGPSRSADRRTGNARRGPRASGLPSGVQPATGLRSLVRSMIVSISGSFMRPPSAFMRLASSRR